MVVKKDRVVLICQTFVSRPFYLFISFFVFLHHSLAFSRSRTRTTRSFSPLFSVFHSRRAFPFSRNDVREGKQIIQGLNGYLESSPLCWRAGRTYAHIIIYEERQMWRRRGYSYNFIYTHEVGDTKVNDTEHDSNTPTDLCRLRDSLLTYIKICANTFDNHKYIYVYIHLYYYVQLTARKDCSESQRGIGVSFQENIRPAQRGDAIRRINFFGFSGLSSTNFEYKGYLIWSALSTISFNHRLTFSPFRSMESDRTN